MTLLHELMPAWDAREAHSTASTRSLAARGLGTDGRILSALFRRRWLRQMAA